ncbi:hypothetical protein ACFWY6_40685 [Streptomyces sp. NPDC059037]|uniref:hypothetical protein n=1 Tax=Streptomyces sp. NPDC059037 TaxID=3346710 RepID=UPI0036C5A133
MAKQPSDDLYDRYMGAFEASAQHFKGCDACQEGRNCPEGASLHERFARLQDAFRARQSKRRR